MLFFWEASKEEQIVSLFEGKTAQESIWNPDLTRIECSVVEFSLRWFKPKFIAEFGFRDDQTIIDWLSFLNEHHNEKIEELKLDIRLTDRYFKDLYMNIFPMTGPGYNNLNQ